MYWCIGVLLFLSDPSPRTAVRGLEKDTTHYFQGDTVEELLKSALAADLNGQYQKAIDLFDKAIAKDPKAGGVYHRRGLTHFKLGNFAASIADFDKEIALEPKRKAGHWQRGISYYYAGRFDDGIRQFEGYQTVDSNDVENAVWRYLCMARKDGTKKARADMLKICKDVRVPMKEIYELFRGRLKPGQVLDAAKAGEPDKAQLNSRLFYAHLYLGLYFETEGDAKKALEHLTIAADHKIGHYMWDVARVHRDLLRKAAKKP
jgi:lipoprotein NlpI